MTAPASPRTGGASRPAAPAALFAAVHARLATRGGPDWTCLWPTEAGPPPDVPPAVTPLDLDLDPDSDAGGATDDLGAAWERALGPAARRATGVFYTPPRLVATLCRALEIPREASVWDPSCGSGRFLAAIAHERDPRAWRGQLFGGDVDPVAVVLARARLWLLAHRRGVSLGLTDLCEIIAFRDGLAGMPRRFDVVLGNPPYVPAQRLAPAQRRDLLQSGRFASLRGRWDLSVPFIDVALDHLAPEGRHGYVVPQALLTEGYGEAVRRRLAATLAIEGVLHLAGAGAFSGATVPCALYWGRRPGPTRGRPRHYRARLADLPALGPSATHGDPDAPLRPPSAPPPRPRGPWHRLGDLCLVMRGPELQSHERHDPPGGGKRFVKDDLVHDAPGPARRPYVEGSDLRGRGVDRVRYVEWGTARVPDHVRRPRVPALLDRPKLLLAITGGAVALDAAGALACNHSVNLVIRYADIPGELDGEVVRLVAKSDPTVTGLPRAERPAAARALLAAGRERSRDVALDYLAAVLACRWLRVRLEAATSRDRADLYPDDIKAWPIPCPGALERAAVTAADGAALDRAVAAWFA